MARPAAGYRLKDGTRVPGASTVAKIFDDGGALLYWANQQGLEGKTLQEAREPVMTAGTLIHDCIEAWLHNEIQPEIPLELSPAVANGFSAFKEWYGRQNLEPLETEAPRVSEEYRFGGTPDLIAQDHEKRPVLIDWKSGTGSRIFASQLLQIRAYGELVLECDHIEIERYEIVRFDRETGDFTHVVKKATSMETCWAAFFLCLRIYELRKEVKKLV